MTQDPGPAALPRLAGVFLAQKRFAMGLIYVAQKAEVEGWDTAWPPLSCSDDQHLDDSLAPDFR